MAAEGSAARTLLERALAAASAERASSSAFVNRAMAVPAVLPDGSACGGAAPSRGAAPVAQLPVEDAPSSGAGRALALLARAQLVAACGAAGGQAAAASPHTVPARADTFDTPAGASIAQPAAASPALFLPPVPVLGGVSVQHCCLQAAASPSLLDVATAVGAVAAIRQRPAPALPSPSLPSPIAPPPSVVAAPAPPPPPLPDVVPLLFLKGSRLFASKQAPLSAPAMRARAYSASAFPAAREGDAAVAPPARLARASYRPGVASVTACELAPVEAAGADEPPSTADAVKTARLHAEIQRFMGLMTVPMVGAALQYSVAEAEAMPPAELSSQLFSALARRGVSSVSNARRALLRLYDFALARGVQLSDFNASVGMISAFLAAQSAATMPRALLLGLRWAATVVKLCPSSTEAILDGFKSKASPSAPRPAMCFSLRLVIHLTDVACEYTGAAAAYVTAVAAGVLLLVQGSLRWSDGFGCTFKVQPDAIDGFTKRSKTGPMPWWAELDDVFGRREWVRPLLASLTRRDSDYVFRLATFRAGSAGDPLAFTGWGKGPAPKAHVLKGLQYILTLPPLNLDPEAARRFLRLHGARRFYATAARYLSGVIRISTQDRLEMGRWQPGLLGTPAERASAAAARLPNLYGDEAARARCVASRGRVAAELRRRVASLSAEELRALPLDGSGLEFLMEGVPVPTVADPDPDLSDGESDVEVA